LIGDFIRNTIDLKSLFPFEKKTIFLILLLVSGNNRNETHIIQETFNHNSDTIQKMKIRQIVNPSILIILSLVLSTKLLQAQEHNFDYKEVHKYEIDENDSSYELYSEKIVTNKYLSKPALGKDKYFIIEYYFDKIKGIWGYKNKHRLSSANIGFDYPPDEDVFISDDKIHYIYFDDLKVGDEVEYHYKNEIKDIVFSPIITIPNINFVDEFKVQIEHPDDVYIDFEFYFPHGKLKYKIKREDDYTELEFDSLEKSPDLEFSPFTDKQAYILLILKKNGIPVNGVEAAGFVNWYSKLANINPVLPDTFKTFFDSLLTGATDKDEKLRVIDDYVRKNIRYIADERDYFSIVPRQPGEVLKRKYGDCKDRAFLVSAIARAYNIKVCPALVSTEFEPDFKAVHPGLFNHVICVYNDGKKDVYFDPTAKYFEFKLLPSLLLNKKTLILDSANPRVSYIKSDEVQPGIDISIKGDLDSLRYGRASITLSNQLCAHAIHALKELTDNQVDNFLSRILKTSFRLLAFDHFVESDSSNDEEKKSITFNSSVDLSKFIISTASNKYVSKTPFLLFDNRILEREKDTLPVYTDRLPVLKLRMELSDTSYSMKPDSLTMENNETRMKFNANSDYENPGKFFFNYSFYPTENYLTKSKKNALINFCRDYFNNKKQMFLIKGKKL
jgi:Domain of Unknown Function with PDB structure (DUF3857)/Transglutaminase-like superfamily